MHKAGWNTCVTDGLKGEGRPQEPSFLTATCRHKYPFADMEIDIKGRGRTKNAWAKGKKCAFGRLNAGLVMCSSRVRA